MTTMVQSLAPRQTLLEQKIEALGPAATLRLCTVLISVVVGVAAVVAQTPAARAAPLFSLQVFVVAVGVAAAPLLVHHSPDLSKPAVVLAGLAFSVLALLPVTYAFLKNLLMGHVGLEDPQWYDAVWRIYAVLGVWMLFAIVNEAKVRPYLRARDIRLKTEAAAAGTVPTAARNTVASRADAMRRAARHEKLTALRESLIAAKGRRDAARAAVDGAAETAAVARRNVAGAAKLVASAEGKVAEIGEGGDGYAAACAELETVRELATGAAAHEQGLGAQGAAHELVLAEAEERIKELDEKWVHWSNLDNYPFYR
jgi:hypothetical protein